MISEHLVEERESLHVGGIEIRWYHDFVNIIAYSCRVEARQLGAHQWELRLTDCQGTAVMRLETVSPNMDVMLSHMDALGAELEPPRTVKAWGRDR